MPPSTLTRKVVCPKCAREQFTSSPDCMCYACYARWTIDWRMSPEEFWSLNSSTKARKTIMQLAHEVGVDAKALHILFNTQWNLDGKEGAWIAFSEVPPDDLAYAKAAGVMQDSFELDHEALTARIVQARDKLDRRFVVQAFAASLVTRRMDHRSILGSYAWALHLAPHAFVAEKDGEACHRCGASRREKINVNHCTFRRLFWAGNIQQGRPDYILCDLNAFAEANVEPKQKAKELLEQMFAAIRNLPPQAGLSELEKSIGGLFPGNKRERQVVLEIFGYCGILKPKEFPSPHERWIPRHDYPEPSHFFRKEWRSPVSCWTGADGVNDEAIEFWFGDL